MKKVGKVTTALDANPIGSGNRLVRLFHHSGENRYAFKKDLVYLCESQLSMFAPSYAWASLK